MNKTEKIAYLIAGIIFFLIFSFLYNGLIVSKVRALSNLWGNIASIGYIIVLLVLIILYHKKVNNLKLESFLSFRLRDVFIFICGALICLVVLLIQLAFIKVLNLSDITINNYNIADYLDLFLNNFIISGFEELFFRVFVFVTLVKIFGRIWVPLILSSILFSLVHLNNLEKPYIEIGLLNIFIGGCLLAYLYYITNSIWSSIGFHCFNNVLNEAIITPDNFYIYLIGTLLYLTVFLLITRDYGLKNQLKVLSVE